MKKLGLLFVAITMSMFLASMAGASTFSTTLGTPMTVSTSVAGADNMVFNPSPKVNMSGMASALGFAVNGVHSSAIGTEGGKAYGMCADSNKVFFSSAASTTYTLPPVATSQGVSDGVNDGEFSDTTEWTPMS